MPSSDPERDLQRDFLEDLCESDPATDMSRIEDDKGILLPRCFDWILNNKEFRNWQECKNIRLLWVKGNPGKGKTMLMIGLVRRLQAQLRRNCALAYFFCQSADQRLNNGISVLRGLVWTLLSKNLLLCKHIPKEYRSKSKEKRKAMFKSQNPNLFLTLKTMLDDVLIEAPFDKVYLLVDALDECDEHSDQLVRWMTQVTAKPSSKAKWLVSSRFSLPLDRTLHPTEYRQKLDLELNDEHVSHAVAQFIQQKVQGLAEDGKYGEELRKLVQTKLLLRAESTFLWVALICEHLKGIARWEVLTEIDKFKTGLQDLYDRMMYLIEKHSPNTSRLCKQILRAVTIVYHPLTIAELVPLAELPTEQADDVRELISLCSSFVILRGDTVRFLHQSAKDYLKANHASNSYAGGLTRRHIDIGIRSIKAMSSVLRRNMYDLDYCSKPEDMKPPQPDPLAPIRYSCLFWADHVTWNGESPECKRVLADDGEVFKFLKERLLHWLESLSLLGTLPEGMQSIRKLLHITQGSSASPQLARFLEDAERLFRSYGSIIERAPLQTYGSALIFSPTTSEVKITQWKQRLPFIQTVTGIRTHWDAHRQTLEGHSGIVWSVVFSPDGKTLGSASVDRTIRLWDTASGGLRETLKGHGNSVSSVAFSSDGKTLASASVDRTILLWDTATGIPREILKGHSDRVTSMAFLPDGKTLASASVDRTILLWDTATGRPREMLKCHSGVVWSVAFSPDGKTLATASVDGTIGLLDAATGSPRKLLKGHSGVVWSVVFSPDGKTLASASDDRTVLLWDTATWTPCETLKGHNGMVTSVAFSPDGRTLASASVDRTIRLWDTTTEGPLETLKGHSDRVTSMAFSPDGKTLASASVDRTILLWDTATGRPREMLKCHSGVVWSVAFSPDGRYLTTDYGSLRLSTSAASEQCCAKNPSDHALDVDREWITLGGKKILWLPTEYRAFTIAVYGKKMALGHRSGGITFLEVKIV